MKRERQISLYLSQTEWEAIGILAEYYMMSKSAVLRMLISERLRSKQINSDPTQTN